MSLALHFSAADWLRIEHNWNAWWAGELQRPLVVLECIEPGGPHTPHYASTFLGNYQDIPADTLLELFVPRLQATHYLGDAFPRFWPNFGPGILAAFAGAYLHPTSETTWFSPASIGPLADQHVTCDRENPWWRRVVEVTQAAVERWGQQLSVGLTDLGGNLDILASLRSTQGLLLELMDAPAEIDRLVAETTHAWLQCFDDLVAMIHPVGRGITCWGPCWSPDRGYMLQCDLAYMISPSMFDRFVLPYLEECCRAMDYAFYHLDGKGQIVHLDSLLSLARLRGIQWVPGDGQPPPEEWLPILKRIRAAGKFCQVTVSPQGALTIIRELGGEGFVFLVGEPQLTPEQGATFLEQVGV